MLQTLLNRQKEGVGEAGRTTLATGTVGFSPYTFGERDVWFAWFQIDHFREVDWK
jgi:hypothetical protein